jgi:hypothetical protein
MINTVINMSDNAPAVEPPAAAVDLSRLGARASSDFKTEFNADVNIN